MQVSQGPTVISELARQIRAVPPDTRRAERVIVGQLHQEVGAEAAISWWQSEFSDDQITEVVVHHEPAGRREGKQVAFQ
jgi:hypothetical protein